VTHTSTTPVPIAARPEVRFDFVSTSAVHHADNPYLSHFWNALSIMTPATERILIRIARDVRDEVSDDQIRADIDALVAQEALHTREHRRLNARLDELGYAVGESTAEMDRILDDHCSRIDARSAVALMVAGEHLIYELCSALVDDSAVTAEMEPEVRRLLTWHAAEEIEHQSVRVRNSPARRRRDPHQPPSPRRRTGIRSTSPTRGIPQVHAHVARVWPKGHHALPALPDARVPALAQPARPAARPASACLDLTPGETPRPPVAA
jgi:hypothetical protein